MGQQQSKRVSSTSSHTLFTTYSSPPNSPHTSTTLCDEITPPAPVRELNRLSDIIDPRKLLNDEMYNVTPTRPRALSRPLTAAKSHGLEPSSSPTSPRTPTNIVHSPSGSAFVAEEFVKHPNRPLAMWERQERVIQGTREGILRFEAESRLGNRSRQGVRSRLGSVTKEGGKRRRWWCCGCWTR